MKGHGFCLFAALSLLSARAEASPLFELVGTSTAGFNARATGASAASTYFNPALLPRAAQGVELGWLVLYDRVRIGLDARPPGNDVPLSALDRVRTAQPPFPTDWLEHGCTPETGRCLRTVAPRPRGQDGSSNNVRGYQMLGLVNHVLGDRLSLGLTALVPLSSFTQAHSFFVDEREQFFTNSLHPEMYADRLTPVSLAFGAGSRIWDGLSIGLSFTLGLSNGADAGAYVGNSSMLAETLQLSTEVDVAASVSPHVGLSYDRDDGYSVSFTLHSPQKVEIETEFGIYLPNGDLQRAKRTATHDYLPWIAALAGTYDLIARGDVSLNLAATVSFERWSQYLNRQTERPRGDYAWRDTVSGSLGLHYATGGIAAYCDLTARPSPVPEQTGRTNYVDNDRYGAVMGGSYELPRLQSGLGFRFGAQAQVHMLSARHHEKSDPQGGDDRVIDEWPDDSVDVTTGQVIAEASGLQTNNPGWPGYRSRGFLIGGMLTAAMSY